MTPFSRHWGAAGGAPALLLHCSLAHSGAWQGMARLLEGHLRMAAPDLPGHGRAPDPEPGRDFHDQATSLALACLPDGPCHLIGHSFGATVALRLAEEMPDRVATLTLIEPVLFAAARGRPGQVAEEAAMGPVHDLLRAGDDAGAARLFLSLWGGEVPFDRMPPAQREYLAGRIHLIPAAHGALYEDAAGLLPRLGRVRAPTLLVRGADSQPVIAEVLDALATALPVAARLTVPGAGHMVPITHPEPVARAVRTLVGGV